MDRRPYFNQDPGPETMPAVWHAVRANEDRITELEAVVEERKGVMRETITSAVRDAMPRALLTDQQHRWVEMAIEREAQTLAFRRAIIEKTTSALVWALIAGVGMLVWVPLREFIANHFWKP